MMEVYQAIEHLKDMEIRKADFVDDNKCIKCLGPAKDFKNDLCFMEFLYYSGHCQDCQDSE